MGKLDHKVVVVTGAAQGIGLGCARRCLEQGARVAIVDKAPTHVVEAALPGAKGILVQQCDVTDANALEDAIAAVAVHFGQLDGLVNNAGWHPPAMGIEETSLQDFEGLLRLNLTSTFLACKFALPHLKRSRGAIVNMASAAGVVGQGQAPAYAASKAGQLGLTKALALDLAPAGVRVNAICPAGVMTPLMEEWARSQYDPQAALKLVDSWHALGRMATPEEIGEVCTFLLSYEAAFITGQAIGADGGALLGYKR